MSLMRVNIANQDGRYERGEATPELYLNISIPGLFFPID